MNSTHFCDRSVPAEIFGGKRVALIGSGPSCAKNPPHHIDRFDVVVRVNNYKLLPPATGKRTDVFYSYFGNAIRKTKAELVRDGVKLCMCKCPDAKFIDSEWHRNNGKEIGTDFRWIYERRADWWFCPTWVPTVDDLMGKFELLGKHMPTTGFAALLDVLSFEPASVYLTGFDFFISRRHNVNERWRPGDPEDPIGHDPDAERRWLHDHRERLPLELDETAARALAGRLKSPPPDPPGSRYVARLRRLNAQA